MHLVIHFGGLYMKKPVLTILILSLLLSICSCDSSNSKEIESLNQKISELEEQVESTTVSPSTASVQGETTSQPISNETLVNSNPEIYSNIEYLPQTMSLEEMQAIDTLEEWADVSPANRAAYFLLTNGYSGHTAEDINDWTTEKTFFDSLKFFAKSDLSKATASAFAYDGLESVKIGLSQQYYLKNAAGELEPGTTTISDYFMQDHDGGSSNTDLVFLKSGTPRQIGKDALTGEPIIFTNVTYEARSNDGSTVQKPESTMQLIEVPVHLETGEDVIFYMMGYGADGETTPDADYPY